jgi:hypothetical protein
MNMEKSCSTPSLRVWICLESCERETVLCFGDTLGLLWRLSKGLYKCQVILLAAICMPGGRGGGKWSGIFQTCIKKNCAGRPHSSDQGNFLKGPIFLHYCLQALFTSTFHFCRQRNPRSGRRSEFPSPGSTDARVSQQREALTRIRGGSEIQLYPSYIGWGKGICSKTPIWNCRWHWTPYVCYVFPYIYIFMIKLNL